MGLIDTAVFQQNGVRQMHRGSEFRFDIGDRAAEIAARNARGDGNHLPQPLTVDFRLPDRLFNCRDGTERHKDA